MTELFQEPKPTQYFSKWRQEWIDFSPTEGELIAMKKYYYETRSYKKHG